ncbi:hypothetical protein M2G90_20395 [Vibrio vulnificus]|nr:hypothetical protein [Vibrio vulnificus]
MKLWPSRKQYLTWSMPSKLTFISSYISFITLIFSLLSYTYSYLTYLNYDNVESNYSIEEEMISSHILGVYEGSFLLSKVYLNERSFKKPVYEHWGVISSFEEEDFDFDGNKDLLFSITKPGEYNITNLPEMYIILLSKGGGYVKLLSHDEFWSTEPPEVTFVNNRWLFKVNRYAQNFSHPVVEQDRLIFTIENGDLTLIERLDANLKPRIKSKFEINSSDLGDRSNTRGVITLPFPLKVNSHNDSITCDYDKSWSDLLYCAAFINEVRYNIESSCYRIGVTDQVFDGYYKLVCDTDDILIFDKVKNAYVLQNKN